MPAKIKIMGIDPVLLIGAAGLIFCLSGWLDEALDFRKWGRRRK
jgi:hypothetical protein